MFDKLQYKSEHGTPNKKFNKKWGFFDQKEKEKKKGKNMARLTK